MAGRRLQDWTNRNVFVDSFDWPSDTVFSASSTNDKNIANNLQTINESGQDIEQNKTVPSDITTGEAPAEDLDEEGLPTESITALQGVWNITNAIQGMFIVGLPFAIKIGGWFAVFALVMVAYICYRTGLALIDCLYDEEDDTDLTEPVIQTLAVSDKRCVANRHKVRHSYREVADAVRPGLGHFVLAAQLTELLSTCILYIVLAGDLLQGCLPSIAFDLSEYFTPGSFFSPCSTRKRLYTMIIDRSAWMMLVTSILLGTAFLTDIRVVSDLSFANAISHLAVNLIVVLYCLSQEPREFKWVLSQSHIAAALFKAIFGLIGFLTFANFTQKEISNSLPNQAFKVLVNLILVVKALLSYPLPYFATVQLLMQNFFRGSKEAWFSSCFGKHRTLRDWALCLRIILILWTLMIALSVPYLIELMGLIGNITGTVLSFIWPAYFHLRLKGPRLSDAERRFDKFVIVLGASMCVIGVYYSAAELRAVVSSNAAEIESDL